MGLWRDHEGCSGRGTCRGEGAGLSRTFHSHFNLLQPGLLLQGTAASEAHWWLIIAKFNGKFSALTSADLCSIYHCPRALTSSGPGLLILPPFPPDAPSVSCVAFLISVTSSREPCQVSFLSDRAPPSHGLMHSHDCGGLPETPNTRL